MEKGEEYLDRNREAPVTNYEMGLNGYDIIPDPYSPKFQRERSYSEKGLQVHDKERIRRRHHCHHHRIHCNENAVTVQTTKLTTSTSEPNLRRMSEISKDCQQSQKKEYNRILKYYIICAAVGIFVIFLSLAMIHYYGQDLDRLLSCDKTRYIAVAYDERGPMYYLCRALKTIRIPGL